MDGRARSTLRVVLYCTLVTVGTLLRLPSLTEGVVKLPGTAKLCNLGNGTMASPPVEPGKRQD